MVRHTRVSEAFARCFRWLWRPRGDGGGNDGRTETHRSQLQARARFWRELREGQRARDAATKTRLSTP